ncbi:pyridoxal phosphate-dependent aminotransferase [Amycolatopsis cihanbeyliensis]|uniref:Aminotransferase n=1 Tax=Amycolatopsis cihanbeyliensis TaxID=1128664 RepID=A0A542DIA0_AMYCI|nr:pyridoxal phosphate-dependent aminotransferase [Amycolatopsis cihanbeyliensis]TQJ02821.1 aspartate aminotransferase [Amycolatopsis cihanbeyliensis]
MVRHSATLAINERLEAKRAAGERVLHLGFGEAGLPVPPAVATVLAEAAGSNGYGPVAGSARARAAVAGYFSRRGLPTEADRVLLAPGSKALLFALLSVLPGDVVLPRPCWVSYAAQAALAGKQVIDVPIPPAAGGVPEPRVLETALAEARAAGAEPGVLILTVPDNPTGTVAGPELIEQVCAVADRHGLVVISDEIYRDLVHEGSVYSPATVLAHRTVVTAGLSKNLALGGYRIGFARLPSGPGATRLRTELIGVASEVWSSLPAPMQEVAAYALDEPAEVREHIERGLRLHRTVAAAVHREFLAAGASARAPQAGFYLYPDLESWRGKGFATGKQLTEHLLNRHGVGVLAGVEFGDDPGALRFRVATSLLYGSSTEQRWAALHSEDPLSCEWIAEALTHLRTALTPREP